MGFGLTVGALAFILMGDGIIYFANLLDTPSGAAYGSTLADVGYTIIGVMITVFALVICYLLYQRSQNSSSPWSAY